MLILLALSAQAATYDVNPGDDLFGIIEGVVAGDEVIVHAGTYSSQQQGGSWFRQLTLNGTEADPIVIRAGDGEAVLIEGDPGASQNTINIEGSWYTWKGFEMAYGSHAVRIHTSDHATFEDLHIHDTGDVGISANVGGMTYEALLIKGLHIHDTAGTGECMYLGCNDDACQMFDSIIESNWCHDTYNSSQGDGIEVKTGSYGNVIRNNVIHDVQYPGITMYGTRGRAANIVEGNVIWNAGDNGIQLVSEALVQNNIVLNSGNNGIQAKNSQGQDPSDLIIVHNTVIDAGAACMKGNDWDGATNIDVANNAFFCEGGTAINVVGGEGDTEWAANAVVGSSTAGNTTPGAMADLADLGGRDVYPADDASLIDAGDVAWISATDFFCTTRTGAPDQGAYEWTESGNPGWIPEPGFKPDCPEGTTTDTDTAPPTDTDTDTDTTGGDTDTTGGDTADDAEKGGGCGCNSGPPPLALGWLVLLLSRRRERCFKR